MISADMIINSVSSARVPNAKLQKDAEDRLSLWEVGMDLLLFFF